MKSLCPSCDHKVLQFEMSLILLKRESHESAVIVERISCSKELIPIKFEWNMTACSKQFRSETVGALQTLQLQTWVDLVL